jgi:hypothetical protein
MSCLRRLGVLSALLCVASGAHAQPLNLPDPLVLPDKSRITTSQQWMNEQRGRLLDLFQQEVYGKPTVGRPANMTFNVMAEDATAMGGQATLRRVEIRIQNDAKTGSFTVRLVSFTPNAAPQKPVRAFVYVNPFLESDTDPTRATKSDHWPAEAIIARGFGAVALYAADLDPDINNFDNGVHKFYDNGVRGPSTWGTLAAWAWGASRAMDYVETDPRIDRRAVAVIGWSRGGKAALVAGATDQRFALTISNESGEGGAALARRNHGEGITDINTQFPHWFALNFRKYNGAPETLPVDSHELLAMMAPRAVYVSSASLDDWADPMGEFLGAVNAAPVYQLFGIDGLGTMTFPAPGEHIHKKQMGYHLRVGTHDLTRFDWDLFMDFFSTVEIPVDAPPDAGSVVDSSGSGGASNDGAVVATTDSSAAAPEASSSGSAGSGPTPPATADADATGALAPASDGSCACRLATAPGGAGPSYGAALLVLGALRRIGRRSRKVSGSPTDPL